jgi:hypothetical protein
MAFDVTACLEEARALGHRLYAFCSPYYFSAKRNVTDFMESKSKTSDASFHNGLLQAFLTCAVLAPVPLMYWLWLLNASFWVEVPLWYGLLLFMNVPQKMMAWKTVAQIMFIAAVCLLYFLQYRHWSWACLMCYLSRLRMNGNGKVMVLWQLRVETYIYEYVRCMIYEVFKIRTMKPEDRVCVVQAEGMIYNPFTFISCAMVACNWEAWHREGWEVDLRDWTRIVSAKRAFVALNLWRFFVFGLPYGLSVLVGYLWPATVETVVEEFEQPTVTVKPESDGNLTEEEYKIFKEFLQ